MKLVTNTQVSVDGVVQGNGGRAENRRGGFERGGWALPLFDEEARQFVDSCYQRADAFLFGRRTYDLFARYWGVMAPGAGPIPDALNTRPKFVASTTFTEATWAGTDVLSGDLETAVQELTARPGGELQVHGSPSLVRWLLEKGLVDELILLVCPVIVGQGTRLLPQSGPDQSLELSESRAFPKGIIMQTYRPAGPPTYAA